MKFIYLLLVAFNIAMCVIDIIAGDYVTAIWVALVAVWTYMMYRSQDRIFSLIAQVQELLTENYLKSETIKSLRQENAELRDALKKIEERTPARGTKGRFEKREKNDDNSKFVSTKTHSVVK